MDERNVDDRNMLCAAIVAVEHLAGHLDDALAGDEERRAAADVALSVLRLYLLEAGWRYVPPLPPSQQEADEAVADFVHALHGEPPPGARDRAELEYATLAAELTHVRVEIDRQLREEG